MLPVIPGRNHSFNMCAIFSKKLTFLTPWYAHGAYQEVRNVNFAENFAFKLNGLCQDSQINGSIDRKLDSIFIYNLSFISLYHWSCISDFSTFPSGGMYS